MRDRALTLGVPGFVLRAAGPEQTSYIHPLGLAYGVAAYGLFRLFESEGRRRASLETF